MGIPGGLGGLKAAESQAMGQIKSQESSTISSLESQKESALAQASAQETKSTQQTAEEIKGQINHYESQQKGIIGAIKSVEANLSKIPNIDNPQAQEARKRLLDQLKEYRSALKNIQQAIAFARQQLSTQIGRIKSGFSGSKRNITKQIEGQKEAVKTQFKEQKKQVMMKFAGQIAAMQEQMSLYQKFRGQEGAGRTSG
ncbi:MAG TPA: hypothetical protein VGA67_05625 [Candidatus Dojkabacteria bacterium]|jgi:hypothetical protein